VLLAVEHWAEVGVGRPAVVVADTARGVAGMVCMRHGSAISSGSERGTHPGPSRTSCGGCDDWSWRAAAVCASAADGDWATRTLGAAGAADCLRREKKDILSEFLRKRKEMVVS
jgi:hypothetical protein